MTKCSYLIPLTKGYHAIVDKDGYKKVKNYKWRAKIEGKQGQYIYAFNNKLGRMHRYIMNYPENLNDKEGSLIYTVKREKIYSDMESFLVDGG